MTTCGQNVQRVGRFVQRCRHTPSLPPSLSAESPPPVTPAHRKKDTRNHSDETTRQCHRLNTEQRTSDTTHQPTNTTATSFETISARGDRGEHRVPIQAPDPCTPLRSLAFEPVSMSRVPTTPNCDGDTLRTSFRTHAKSPTSKAQCSKQLFTTACPHSKHVQGTRFP